MKTKILTLLVALPFLTSLISSCSAFCEKGEGGVTTRNLELSDFDKIEISGKAKVFIEQSQNTSVSCKIDSNLVDLIKFEVSGSTLEISETKCISKVTAYEIHISTPNLYYLNLDESVALVGTNILMSEKIYIKTAGSSSADLKMNIDEIEIDTRGKSVVKISGRSVEIDIDAEDASKIDASSLQTKKADVDISQSAVCELNVSEKIKGEVNGSGKLFYKGNPKKVKTNVHDAGMVRAL